MGSIMNGIALHGGTRVYGGTFLTFSDYMRGAVRLAASCSCRSPTCGPRLDRPRRGRPDPPADRALRRAARHPRTRLRPPADANETAVAWRTILEHNDRPAGLALSRQNLPVVARGEFASAEGWHAANTCSPRRRTAPPR